MQLDMMEILANLGMTFVPFLFALCFHEFAHGWVAKLRGDRTAELEGRLTMNPVAHADPIGTWLLPISAIALNTGFLFGWAKPVPVDSRNLKRPKQDMFWVALAGPMSNVLLAFVSAVILAFVAVYMAGAESQGAVIKLLQTFILINIFLALLNLIPIHPLDGGKVIQPFIPHEWDRWLENNQQMLGMGLLVFMLMGGGLLARPAYALAGWLIDLSQLLIRVIA